MTIKRTGSKLSLLVLAFALLPVAQARENTKAETCVKAVLPQLEQSGGRLTHEVRSAYLAWAEVKVLQGILDAGLKIPSECLVEVRADPILRDAMFGSIFPPDPSVFQNYARLRRELSPSVLRTYRSLVIAVAIAHRTKGVESAPMFESNDVWQDNIPADWGDHMLESPPQADEEGAIRAMSDFMKANNVSALELYSNRSLQVRLAAYLRAIGIPQHFIDETHQGFQFGQRLKYAMVALGQRPAARQPNPTPANWIAHLAQILDTTPPSTPIQDGRPMPWPLFPVKSAPWPLLLPLAHEVPMSEAEYIWSKFLGADGTDRFHTYGPYRMPDDVMPDMLRPSKWFWTSYPDQIVHGGTCIPISDGTIDLYAALGQPAVGAGQPAHANLISYQNVGGMWKAEIEQAFAGGPDVTCAQWWFNDEPLSELRFYASHHWPMAEYNLGLPLGMNPGLDSYIDSRIGFAIFEALPYEQRKALGLTLLESVLQKNPFNPAIWYRLAALPASPDETCNLIQALVERNPACFGGEGNSVALDRFSKNGTSIRGALDQYWNTLSPVVAANAMATRSAPLQERDRSKLFTLLEQVPGLAADAIANYAEKFADGADTAESLKLDEDLAAKGDSFGLLRMGQRYRDGDGVQADDLKSNYMFLRATQQGDAASVVLLDRLNPLIPMDGIAVTASSTGSPTQNVKHLVDGSGMAGGLHDNSVPAATMWHTYGHSNLTAPAPGIAPSPAWVRFDFPHPVTFDAVKIWNHNQANLTNRGMKNIQIYGSAGDSKWFYLAASVRLTQASGSPHEPGYLIPSLHPERLIKTVIIAADPVNGNYGGDVYGLSAVRFTHKTAPTIPPQNIQVSASSTGSPAQDVRHLVDGQGMTGPYHDNKPGAETMWHSLGAHDLTHPAPTLALSPAWVRFDFSQPRRFATIQIWNHNQANLTNRGMRKVRIYGSQDGSTWSSVTYADVTVLPEAPGTEASIAVSSPNSQPTRPLKSVIIAAEQVDGNYGGNVYGLSAVRFVLHD